MAASAQATPGRPGTRRCPPAACRPGRPAPSAPPRATAQGSPADHDDGRHDQGGHEEYPCVRQTATVEATGHRRLAAPRARNRADGGRSAIGGRPAVVNRAATASDGRSAMAREVTPTSRSGPALCVSARHGGARRHAGAQLTGAIEVASASMSWLESWSSSELVTQYRQPLALKATRCRFCPW